MRIYTAGYYGRDINELTATVTQLDAMVVDIRLVPQSRFTPQWRKANLERLYGENYLHIKELGNKGFKEKRIEIADMDSGLAIVESLGRDVVLLCACKHFDKCHRQPIAEALGFRGYEVIELSD
jgi:uncharacterized protein (DUF488 family)